MIEIAGVKYNNDCDSDVDKIISEYERAKYRDPIEGILDDMGIDIFRYAAIQTMENAQIEGWRPPYCDRESNILGCIEHSLASADAEDCLKTMDLEFHDMIQYPEKYSYLVKDHKIR